MGDVRRERRKTVGKGRGGWCCTVVLAPPGSSPWYFEATGQLIGLRPWSALNVVVVVAVEFLCSVFKGICFGLLCTGAFPWTCVTWPCEELNSAGHLCEGSPQCLCCRVCFLLDGLGTRYCWYCCAVLLQHSAMAV